MEKKNIKEYLQEMLDRWNKYDELDGFVADNFRVDLEKTLEYWDLRIKDNEQELDKAREEGKLEVLEELLEWDTPLEPIGKFMRLQTKMVEMKRDLSKKV